MTVKMKDFLLQYFMQVYFNDMPPEKYQTFLNYIKNGDDFRGNMKDWKKNLVHEDGGKWKKNDYPDGRKPDPNNPDLAHIPNPNPWEMSDDDWKELYREFRNAFRVMDANRKNFADNTDAETFNADATNFLNDWYGIDRVFSNVTASPEAEVDIQNLANLLNSHQGLGHILANWNVLGKAEEIKDLIKGIKEKKYNSDEEFRKKMQLAASAIHELTTPGMNFNQQVFDALGQVEYKFDNIETGFDEKKVDPTQLQKFKDNHQILLRIVARNAKIREQFRPTKTMERLDAAQKKVAYNDSNSDDFLIDTKDDTLTPVQKFKNFWGDTYKDVFEKYKWLQGDRLYFSPQAANIIGAIPSKVKPTDGLDGIVGAEGDIKKALQHKSASSVKHLGWMTKTLKEIKEVMPEAYKGALHNGTQLHAVISELIVRAVRDAQNGNKDAIAAAKTAMEVISVCKYGMTTGKVMDALRKEKLTLFSDGGLSWNKVEGVKFVSTAIDKTLEFGLKAIAEGVNVVVNAIDKSGSKFKGHRGKKVQSEYQNWVQDNQANKQRAIDERDALNPADDAEKATHQQKLDDLDHRWHINAGNIDRKKQQLANSVRDEEHRKADFERATEKYEQKKSMVDRFDQLESEINQLPNEIDQLENVDLPNLDGQIIQLQNDLSTTPSPFPNALAQMQAQQTLVQLQEQYNQMSDQLAELRRRLAAKQAQRNAMTPAELNRIAYARRTLASAQLDMNTKEVLWNSAHGRNERQQARINEFDAAQRRVNELNEQIDRRNRIVDEWDDEHKNMYDELIQFWDFIETGRDSRTGPFYNRFKLSKKNAQKDFNAQKSNIFNQYAQNYAHSYGMAA